MKYSNTILKMQDTYFNMGLCTGMQYSGDCWALGLEDVGVSKSQIQAAAIKAMEYQDAFSGCMETRRNKEADVLQDKLDRRLKKIYEEKFIKYEDRYEYIKKCIY